MVCRTPLLVLSACGAALAAAEHAPAFVWSPKPLSHIKRADAFHGEASAADVERLVDSLAPATEVVVAFVAKGMDTAAVRAHAGGLPSVEKRLRAAASSLTLPFTGAADVDWGSAVRVAGAKAEEYFKGGAGAAALTNGAPDVVVCELDAPAGAQQLRDYDALVDRITAAVDAGSRGNYAALLTASGAMSPRRLSPKVAVTYLHSTPTLLTAQVVGLMLFIIFISGFCCLFSLQTPKRFDTVKEH